MEIAFIGRPMPGLHRHLGLKSDKHKICGRPMPGLHIFWGMGGIQNTVNYRILIPWAPHSYRQMPGIWYRGIP